MDGQGALGGSLGPRLGAIWDPVVFCFDYVLFCMSRPRFDPAFVRFVIDARPVSVTICNPNRLWRRLGMKGVYFQRPVFNKTIQFIFAFGSARGLPKLLPKEPQTFYKILAYVLLQSFSEFRTLVNGFGFFMFSDMCFFSNALFQQFCNVPVPVVLASRPPPDRTYIHPMCSRWGRNKPHCAERFFPETHIYT